jgi:plasmid stabilization system protein ParE
MKVVYTAEALRNLNGILGFIAERCPTVTASFENRLRAAVMRIGA